MNVDSSRTVRLGTRGSALARWQAEWVAKQLQTLGVAVQLVHMATQGDTHQAPLASLGGQGAFTKEIQRALLDKEIDLAVHSLKDLPTEPIEGLHLAAVPQRESTCDVLVSRNNVGLAELPAQAKVGTGSSRRKAQLLHARADLNVLDIRGNVDTRLQKLDDGQFDAIVLAEAGLARLGWLSRVSQRLSEPLMLPAVGQGALGLETRSEDTWLIQELQPLNHVLSHQAVLAERKLLAELLAGCLAPVGAVARPEGHQLRLDAVVLSLDGRQRLSAHRLGDPHDPLTLGRAVARQLLAQGAAELIRAAH